MRKLLIFSWLLVPFGVAAFHYGPGQEKLKADEGARHLTEARDYLAAGDYTQAVDAFDDAIKALPDDEQALLDQIRLEKAKAMMQCSGLPQAHDDLVALLGDLQGQETAPAGLLADVKSTLASAKYYRTWLMRLEGHAREVWEPEIEASRQYFRAVAEYAAASGNTGGATAAREDLEAAIKLARIDLGELQGLPLPSQ